jgi:Ca-activated chloride channel family protein
VTGGFEAKDVVPDRDFDVYWTLDKADVGIAVAAYKPDDEDGFCMLSLAPMVDSDRDKVEPKDIIFAFDQSGSMSGDKIKQARNSLEYCLSRLDPKDRFAVLTFSTDVAELTDGLKPATPEAVAAAKKKVAGIEARGGTAIHAALQRACKLASGSDRLVMVVFLTDGRPTIGEVDMDVILKQTKNVNKKARLFVFGVGHDVNTDLLDRLATENRGTQQYVGETEDIEVKVSAFYEKIAKPVLTDVSVEAPGIKLKELYPREVPDIFRGGQVLLFGRYEGSGAKGIVVRGKAQGKERVFEVNADFSGRKANDFLPPLWAHRKVAFLLEEIRVRGKSKELADEVRRLGKRYGIVTPYTSFLIVPDEPAVQREVAAARRAFEGAKRGADAVRLSGNLAGAKHRAAPEAADGGGGGYQLGWGAPASPAARTVRRVAESRMRRVADKVFYLDTADGYFYDSEFEERDRARLVAVKPFSDEYFALIEKHADIGKYLASGLKLVICIEGEVYRIGE